MVTLFISDLHLGSARPDKLALFQRLLTGPARKADALYILGDLFETWAGDDDRTSPHPEIIHILKDYTAAGGKLYLMRGNRDYLMGDEFARLTGGTLLGDAVVVDLHGRKTLLLHGDTLCTQDIQYQIFRRVVNNPVSIAVFKCLPYALRHAIWHGVRRLTKNSTARKSGYIMDVHQPEVENVMRRNHVSDLIHGHTHREGLHEFTLDGQPARRYVLSDWYEGDSVLVVDKNGFRMMRVEDYLKNEERVMSDE